MFGFDLIVKKIQLPKTILGMSIVHDALVAFIINFYNLIQYHLIARIKQSITKNNHNFLIFHINNK